MATIQIKFKDAEARSLEGFLQKYFQTKARLPVIAKMAIRQIAAIQAQRELDELNKSNDSSPV